MEQPKIFHYDTVDSTNTVCKSLAAQGAPSGTAVIARRQTAGRGRTITITAVPFFIMSCSAF